MKMNNWMPRMIRTEHLFSEKCYLSVSENKFIFIPCQKRKIFAKLDLNTSKDPILYEQNCHAHFKK